MKIALCCIAKCENLYLSEWVNYHLNLGFDHIYIYDNNDTDGERCEDIIGKENPNVTVLKYFIGKKQRGCETQIAAYNDFYKRFGKKYDWVLYLDVDEFLVLNGYSNVNEYIVDITKPSTKSVRLNWKCYDDNDNLHYECLPVRERFTRVCEDETLSYYKKHFYRTKLNGFKAINVHYSNIRGDVVDCDGKYATYSTFVTSDTYNHNKAYIAHYATKSADEYYMVKKKRRGGGIGNDRLSIEHFFKYNKRTEEKERYLTDLFAGKVEKVKFEESKVAVVNEKPTEGISVCITAYKSQDFIEECLDSVAEQTWFKTHNNWEVIVGIDGCERTLLKMKEIMHKYKNLRVLMMDSNKGTYVTSNTIMREAKYKWLLRFDSDDIMKPELIETCLAKVDNFDFVRFHLENFGLVVDKRPNVMLTWGICMFNRKILYELNGYKNWICGADADLVRRVERHYRSIILDDVLMLRRMHQNSLTIKNETNYKSKLREKYVKFVKTPSNYDTLEKCVNKEMVVNTFYEVFNDYIVASFTTWTKRHNIAAKMLEHFKNQTKKPDKIICWLSSDEYKGENIPTCLQKFVNDGYLEIMWVKENTKAFKRYETFKYYNNCYVVLLDDDVYYDNDYVERVYNAAKSTKSITCYFTRTIEYINCVRKTISFCKYPTIKNDLYDGVTCYPPNTFPLEIFNYMKEREIVSPYCDDSWIKAFTIKNNLPIYGVNELTGKFFSSIDGASEFGIWETHNKKRINGIMQRCINFAKCVAFLNIEEKVNELWKDFDIVKCCNGEYDNIKKLKVE